ncbi:hypothetical protein HQ524_01650 [Candidatus Uhrbacteria bacterium]|nr:hypothetical protein [Candidatus Uhrbacteria bacterium]
MTKLTIRKTIYVLFLNALHHGVCTVEVRGSMGTRIGYTRNEAGTLVEQFPVVEEEIRRDRANFQRLESEVVVDGVYASHNQKKLQRKLAAVRNAWQTAFGVDPVAASTAARSSGTKRDSIFDRAQSLRRAPRDSQENPGLTRRVVRRRGSQ